MSMQTGGLRGEYFVGRRDAFRAFDQFLENGDKRIFLITGVGGIGKTWLLGELKQHAMSSRGGKLFVTNGITDLISTSYHRISSLWSRIVKLSGHPDLFDEHNHEYKNLKELREKNKGFTQADRALRDKSAYVHRLFYDGCNQLPGTFIYWFDTFEAVRDDPVGRWLLEELPWNAEKLRFVIAGRPAKSEDEHLDGSGGLVQRYELSGIDPSEVKDFYLNRFGSEPSQEAPKEARPDADIWERLCEKLEYHPLHIDLARLWAESQVADFAELIQISDDEIIQTLFRHLQHIMRIPSVIPDELSRRLPREKLDSIERAAYEVVLHMALLDRRFDERFLEAVYPEPGEPPLEDAKLALTLMSEAPAIFFVKDREGGLGREGGYLQLHDEVRDRVREILWEWRDRLGDERQELAQKVIGVYDEIIQGTVDVRLREELKVEQLSYLLRIDPQKGYAQFETAFRENFDNQNWGICQLLLNEISPYEGDLGMLRRRTLNKYKFRLALEQRYFETAKGLAETDVQRAEYWLELQRYYVDIDLSEAEGFALKALAIAKDHDLIEQRAQAERALGFVYKATGDLDEAASWYQASQETARRIEDKKQGAWLYADALNNEGYIWALVGDYSKAEELIETAMRLRKSYGWDYEMALSLSTLGEIARFTESFHVAATRYRKATEVFEELHAYDWIAIEWHQRAENMRRVAEQERNGEFPDEEREQKYIKYAVEDIEKSLKLYDLYRLRRELPKAWRRVALIERDRGNLQLARSHFERALKLARESDDYQEGLQALIYISSVDIQLGEYGSARDTLSRMQEFRQANHYPIFDALADTMAAKILIAQAEYDKARQHFVRGLVQLADRPGYGHARLGNIIDRLDQWLGSLPIDKQREWCQVLLQEWQKDGLSEAVPRLPPIVKGYLAALDFS